MRHLLKFLSVPSLVLLGLSGCSHTPDIYETYRSNQPEIAFKLLRQQADEGNADAQFLAGRMLMLGEGIEQNTVEGISYYQKAAAQHHACAMNNLAAEYKLGLNVPKDFSKALSLAQEASLSEHPMALTTLGEMYYLGQGRPIDKKQALSYYLRAMEKGTGSAAFLLGQYYLEEAPTPTNQMKGLKWLYVHVIWQKDNSLKQKGRSHPETDYKSSYFARALKRASPALRNQAYSEAQRWYEQNRDKFLGRVELLKLCIGK